MRNRACLTNNVQGSSLDGDFSSKQVQHRDQRVTFPSDDTPPEAMPGQQISVLKGGPEPCLGMRGAAVSSVIRGGGQNIHTWLPVLFTSRLINESWSALVMLGVTLNETPGCHYLLPWPPAKSTLFLSVSPDPSMVWHRLLVLLEQIGEKAALAGGCPAATGRGRGVGGGGSGGSSDFCGVCGLELRPAVASHIPVTLLACALTDPRQVQTGMRSSHSSTKELVPKNA